MALAEQAKLCYRISIIPLENFLETIGNISLEGIIVNITFHNEENGFSVIKVDCSGITHTVVGQCLYVAIGEHVACEGVWVENKSFGKQLQASSIRLTPPNDIKGMEKYLGSGLIHGIGPQMAKILVDKFQDQVFDVIENHPERLLTIPGIGKSRQQQLLIAWQEQSIMREAMVFLQSFGLGTNRAHMVFRKYGQQTIAMIKHNPYSLYNDIRGIGFKTADAIALKLGTDAYAISRINAGLSYTLEERAAQGHCSCDQPKLIELTQKCLNIEPAAIVSALKNWVETGIVIESQFLDQTWYSLKKIYEAEQIVAEKIQAINSTKKTWSLKNYHLDFTLAESQEKAFNLALEHPCVIITGGPGVGKTTILKAIIQALKASGVNLLLAAPTGRAAKRMQQSTGISAKTIHRLLEYDPTTGAFKKNELQPLETDILILDEASMIDIPLFAKLLTALPSSTSLIIVGDVDQLPSVGPGNVLSDLIASSVIPTARLTEIFRQAKDSSIIINAHRVNNGLYPIMQEDSGLKDFYLMHETKPEEIISKIKLMIADRIPERFNFNPITDIQILTPMRKGLLGTEQLNLELQATLNQKSDNYLKFGNVNYYCNDKVMQHQNDYEKQVFNGDIGYIDSIDVDGKSLMIRFEDKLIKYTQKDLENISLAYACTIHKSQGSEFPVVIMPLHMQHFVLLERNLLYTGLTRAKELVIIIGQAKAIHKAINTITAHKRDTALKHLIIS